MAITLTAAAQVYLAETGDIESLLAGGDMRVLTSADAVLATCSVSSSAGQADGTVDVDFSAGATSAGTPAKGEWRKGGVNMVESSDIVNDVGFSGDALSGGAFEAGGSITPNTLTLVAPTAVS